MSMQSIVKYLLAAALIYAACILAYQGFSKAGF